MDSNNLLKLDQCQSITSSPQSEPKSPILKMPYDIHELVFDYLCLKDLCAVGMTCKRLHQTAGKYFHLYYPSELVDLRCKDGRVYEYLFDDDYETNFGCYTKVLRICFSGEEDEIDIYIDIVNILRHVSTFRNNNLKCIRFEFLSISHSIEYNNFKRAVMLVENVLKKIETVIFRCCSLDANGYDHILRLCANLKHLIIIYPEKFPEQHYPSIENFSFYCDHPINVDELAAFLRFNPQAKKFRFGSRMWNLGKFMILIDKVGLKFDELEFSWDVTQDSVACINESQERGHFKRLSLISHISLAEIIAETKGINGLVGLSLSKFDTTDLPHDATLQNLEKLAVHAGNMFILEQVETLVQCFPNLKVLDMSACDSVRTIEAIVRGLPHLEIINVYYINGNAKFNIETLNDIREMHDIPSELTINLLELPFFKVRWDSLDLRSRLVNIRRSTKWMQPDFIYRQ